MMQHIKSLDHLWHAKVCFSQKVNDNQEKQGELRETEQKKERRDPSVYHFFPPLLLSVFASPRWIDCQVKPGHCPCSHSQEKNNTIATKQIRILAHSSSDLRKTRDKSSQVKKKNIICSRGVGPRGVGF